MIQSNQTYKQKPLEYICQKKLEELPKNILQNTKKIILNNKFECAADLSRKLHISHNDLNFILDSIIGAKIMPKSKILANKVYQLAKNNYSRQEIANKTNKTKTHIDKIIRDYNIPINASSNYESLRKIDPQEIFKLRNQGLSYQQIANKTTVSKARVGQILNKKAFLNHKTKIKK